MLSRQCILQVVYNVLPSVLQPWMLEKWNVSGVREAIEASNGSATTA